MCDEVKPTMKGSMTLSPYGPAKGLVLKVHTSTKGLHTSSLTKAEANYSYIEGECLMVVLGLEHFKLFC